MAVQAQGADSQVAQAGHHAGSGAGRGLGFVLVVGDVAHPVQSILDAPVPADVSGQLLGAGLLGVQAGDAVGDLLADSLPTQAADVAAHPEHLGGVREGDGGVAGDRRDTGGALLGAPVPAVEGNMLGREVAGRAGQRLLERGQQVRLVALDRQYVVGSSIGDQVARGLPLGVQGVGGDHQAAQIQAGQQRCQLGNLVGLAAISRWASTTPLS